MTDGFSVLIAGGGVAALEAALTLRELSAEQTRVELLVPEPDFWYRPASVAEPFGLGTVRRFDLGELAREIGAGLTLGSLVAVDADRREARTGAGGIHHYDALLIACGAMPYPALPGALTFRGPADTELVREFIDAVDRGDLERVAFAVPWGAAWSLPAYELALMTAARVRAAGRDPLQLAVVTPELQPLQLFGTSASQAVAALLDAAGVAFVGGSYAVEHTNGDLVLSSGEVLGAERVIALPRLRGQRIDGIPQTLEGFLDVDEHCGVRGVDAVFAAGDVTSFPVKQGGLAAQQAVAAAEAIAVLAGACLVPQPFRPVLRGLLLTGEEPQYLRRDLSGGDEPDWASASPVWWPPTKIVGRRLTPFLAALTGETPLADAAPPRGGIPVDVPLERRPELAIAGPDVHHTTPSTAGRMVGGLIGPLPPLVSLTTTLDVAVRGMREHDGGSVLVVDDGQLVGILTARDVLRAVAGDVSASDAPVARWMTASPVTVSPETTIDVAEALMTDYGIHHLPVTRHGEPVGMVGLRDLTRDRRRPERLAIGLGF